MTSSILSALQELLGTLGRFFSGLAAEILASGAVGGAALVLSRFLLPLLAILILVRCGRSLMQSRLETETWGQLVLPGGEHLPLNHWENMIGRSRQADVRLKNKTVSRAHAVLSRNQKGEWTLYPLRSKNGVLVNGARVIAATPIHPQDIITFADVSANFLPSTAEEERAQAERRTRPGKVFSPFVTLLLLSLFQELLAFLLIRTAEVEYQSTILICFTALCAAMWALYVIYRIFHRTGFELETLAFFLTSLCLTVTAESLPSTLYKQLFCVMVGLVLFFALSISLRSLRFMERIRWPLAVFSMLLLTFNVLFGARLFGAKNWIAIGPISFQPSEFVKIVFVLVGAATLDKLYERKNLVYSLGFSVFCMGCLGLMSDFGAALIFFVAFLAITFLRSGDLASVLFMVAAAFSGGYIILQYKSYIFERFAVYRHVWEDASGYGYQQTRTMSAIASGGLFGRGVGSSWLLNIGAANTDLVFGVVAEELGLLIALCAVIAIILMALFAVRETTIARSSFYTIAACSTAMLLVVQTMLNVFGSTDLLPLTGVTLPFVSCGGSSMISCWALLAFIKAADTRQNAALSVSLPNRRRKKNAEAEPEPERWETVVGFHVPTQEETDITESDRDATVIRRVKPEQQYRSPKSTDTITGYVTHESDTLKDSKAASSAKTARPAPDAEDFPDFEDGSIPAAGHYDADNWRDYFQWDDDWGKEKED